jgi:hypothetical protein
MFVPATRHEPQTVPLCPTCVTPMALVRKITAVTECELRVFACRGCGIAMFSEIS